MNTKVLYNNRDGLKYNCFIDNIYTGTGEIKIEKKKPLLAQYFIHDT